MIRIAYIDLGLSIESFGLECAGYGGAGVVPRYLKEQKDIEFYCFAPDTAYRHFTELDTRDKCFVLSPEIRDAISKGYPLDKIGDFSSFDILLTFHGNLYINKGNLKAPLCQLCAFDGKAGSLSNDYILFYDDTFVPLFGEKAKYWTLGKPVPEVFQEYKKENFVCQVSRMDTFMNPIETAKNCLKHGIKGIFAGPIHNDYPIKDFMKPGLTEYIGEISEIDKMELYRKARLFCLPHIWEVPFNQSVIEANGVGTPILVTNRGPFFKKYLKEGINGFAYNDNFLEVYNKLDIIKQENCWAAAKPYDVSVMVASLKRAFTEIKSEWKY